MSPLPHISMHKKCLSMFQMMATCINYHSLTGTEFQKLGTETQHQEGF
jgi:hypothetical protein